MMAYQDVFARVEKKYFVTPAQHEALVAAMQAHGMQMQVYGSSTIQSIYYDTPDYLLIRRSIERPNYKEKLRLRTYGHATNESMAFAEIKKKYQHVVYKRRTGLLLPEAMEALGGKGVPETNGQIGKEINYFLDFYGVEPKVIIAYERDAWLDPDPDGPRITFDTNIRFRQEQLDMTLPAEGTLIADPNLLLMEVKVPDAWPLWLTQLLWQLDVRQSHFSKYGTAYTQFIRPGVPTGRTSEVRLSA